MKIKLTDRVVAQKNPPDNELWDELLPGFGLRIGAKRRSYFAMTRIDGKQVRHTIGTTVTHTLAEAREAAREWLRNPVSKQQAAMATLAVERAKTMASQGTFGGVAEAFMNERGRYLRTEREIQRKLDSDILPKWRDIPIDSLGRADVKALFLAKVDESPVAANRTLGLVKTILNFAVDEEWIDHNPAARVKAVPEQTRERYLSAPEIKLFWNGLDAATVEPQVRHCLKFLLATGARRAEACGARWSEFDFTPGAETWTIPAERSKNGRRHLLPLADLALALLDDMSELHDDFVFPGAFGDAPINPYSISQGMRKSLKAMKLSNVTPHDLRRSFASMVTSLGFPRLVVSRLLNHSEGGVTSIYDRHEYGPEMRAAMAAWSDRLREIVEGRRKASNVVNIQRAG